MSVQLQLLVGLDYHDKFLFDFVGQVSRIQHAWPNCMLPLLTFRAQNTVFTHDCFIALG